VKYQIKYEFKVVKVENIKANDFEEAKRIIIRKHSTSPGVNFIDIKAVVGSGVYADRKKRTKKRKVVKI
jgi:hypothetical protein|tara:strand:+ start:647 stop:853 length:207 start_codon:yes stop_codon:yes gene_type:complete